MNSPDFKPIKPYLNRADELDKQTGNPDCKIMAYSCRSYALVIFFITYCVTSNNSYAVAGESTVIEFAKES